MLPVSSVIPALLDALVALCRAEFSDVTVTDGPTVLANQGDYLMIGVDDMSLSKPASSADSTQEWAHATSSGRDETGGITCCLAAWQGDDDLASARRRLFNDLDRLGAVLNGRPPCDIPGLWRTNVTGLDLSQDQTEDGCLAMLVFRIEFSARLPGVGGMGGFA